ncbi:DctP family TRAP transporter solute-binding subunit [Hominiventricola filiformis]|uniref:DctP family TRAP transporter solute-binding subunit n=1 Tax=Hominiventricola filiformis TaxID=2885352 RepID=A0AAE3A696_9FIRM|nr:DctP family TRAP transporter solute-binding subunit [Hominiventricola filiformis]MCC2125502.1 DctP family TRAP transporter solute-binding subunit [Hominiventricola filiformis]
MRRKAMALLLTVAMAAGLTACGGGSSDPASSSDASTGTASSGKAITIKLCHTDPSGCAVTTALQQFAEAVTKDTDGRIVIEEYADGIMGDDDEINEQIYNGAYMMNYSDPALLEPYYPEYSILFSPYFYNSYDEIAKVAQTDFGKRLQAECKEAGLMVLDGMSSYYGSRQIMSKKPINTPDDLKGLNFRMPNNATQLELAEAWGANPATISFSETYTALQQGVVDCVENPIGALKANSIDEVCPYINITNHFYAVNGLVMNAKIFDSLDADLQQILLDDAADFVEYSTKMVADEEEEVLQQMVEDNGVTVNRDVDVEAMKAAAQKVFEVHGWSQELIDEANAALAEVRGE